MRSAYLQHALLANPTRNTAQYHQGAVWHSVCELATFIFTFKILALDFVRIIKRDGVSH